LTVNGKIVELLKVIRESLNMLREYERVPLSQFRNDRKMQDIVEREFERAIMACVDIGARVISSRRLSPASNYTEIFARLMEHGVVGPELTEAMKDFVRFRNILSHEYFQISPDKVHEKLATRLKDFVDYAKALEAYIASSEKR
jgi:uncharacterized protein YutE (UPF0331/DUF86 family)